MNIFGYLMDSYQGLKNSLLNKLDISVSINLRTQYIDHWMSKLVKLEWKSPVKLSKFLPQDLLNN